MTGFEPATSCSQSRRATICATSRFCIEFLSFCVEVGQTVVKVLFHAFLRFCKVPKTRINKGDFFSVCNGFGDLLFGAARRFCPRGLPACSRYQSRRATVLANLFAMYNALHPDDQRYYYNKMCSECQGYQKKFKSRKLIFQKPCGTINSTQS